MLRSILKLSIACSLIGCVIASTAMAAGGPGVTFNSPTEGMTVTDSAGGVGLDFTNIVDLDTQLCRLDDQPYRDCFEVQSFQPAVRNGNHRYYVKTIDIDGDVHIDTVNFVVDDTTPPSFTASVVGGSPVTNNLSFAIDMVDSHAAMLVSIDGRGPERFTAFGGAFNWSPEHLANGDHAVVFRAIDPALNSSTVVVDFEMGDTTAPSITISNPSVGEEFATGSVEATFQTDDSDAKFTCEIDQAPPIACSIVDPVVLESLNDGMHLFFVGAVDRAGNASSAAHSFIVSSDVADGLSIAIPANGSTVTAEPLLDLDAVTAIDETSLRCSVNGGVFVACAEQMPIPGIDHNGSWTLVARARDANGDRVEAQSTFTVNDTSPPTVSLPVGTITVPDADQLTLPGTVSDTFADASPSSHLTITCSVDDAAFTDCMSAVFGPMVGLPATLTAGAIHSLSVRGTDWVGNAATGEIAIDVTDTTAPTVEIVSPTTGSTVTAGGVTIDFRILGGNSLVDSTWCQIDANPAISCADPSFDGDSSWTPRGLTPGTHTLTVSRGDMAGNIGSDSVTITVTDATGPDLTFLAPTAGATLTDRVGVVFAASEKVVRVRCAVDSLGALAENSAQCDTFDNDRRSGYFRPAAIASGAHDLWVEVSDIHGNATAASISITVADTTAPDIRFDDTLYGNGTAGAESPTEISYSSTDPSASFSCSLDSGASVACGMGRSSRVIPPLTNGSHSFRVIATDPSGNNAQRTLMFDVDDVTAPQLLVSGVFNGMAVGASVTADVSSEAGATTQCAVNSGAFANCGIDHDFTFASSGSYSLRFRAIDVAGNATNRVFTVMATVPVPPIDPPSNPGTTPTPALATATVLIAKPTLKMTKKATTLTYNVSVRFPASVHMPDACKGTSAIKVLVGKKSVGRANAALKIVKGACTISGKLKIKTKSIARKKFTLGVTYPGNALVMPFYSAKQGKAGSAKK